MIDADHIATESEYKVRLYIDDEELDLPFLWRSGKDYTLGCNLGLVALDLAGTIVDSTWSGVNEACRVSIFASYPAGYESPCEGDDEPLPLASATAFKW